MISLSRGPCKSGRGVPLEESSQLDSSKGKEGGPLASVLLRFWVPHEIHRVMSENSIGLKTQVLEGLLEATLGQRCYAIF
jgi:hypothetical protein